MPEHTAVVRPADAVESARYQFLRNDPVLCSYLEAGAKAAHEIFMPALKIGHYGITEARIDAGIARQLRAAYTAPRDAGLPSMTRDERLMYRLGFEAVAIPAKEEALAAIGLGVGLFFGALAASLPPTPRLPSHRRLRPEDFGALPTRPRS